MSAPLLSSILGLFAGVPSVFTPPIVGASLISQWHLSELSGTTATDTFGLRNGTYQGAIERNLASIVASDASKSSGFNGSTSGVQILHTSAYLLGSYSIVGYAQVDVLPPAGEHYAIFNKDMGGVAGGVTVELYNDGGQGRGRAYTRTTAGDPIFVGPDGVQAPNGVGTLNVNTAFRWALTVGASGTKLYLNNTLVGRSLSEVGWLLNTVDIYAFISGTGSSAFDGVGKRLQIYSGELTQTEITALPAATSITHGTTGEFITTPEAHGWVNPANPSNPTIAQCQANTAAFQAAINNASANAALSTTGRGVVELVPSRIYTVWVTKGLPRDPNGGLMLDSANQANVEIRTQGKPIGATRATVRMHSDVENSAAANTWGSACTIEIKSNAAQNIWLTHLRVDGNKWGIDYHKVGHIVMGDNAGIHAIGIDGGRNLRLERVEAFDGYIDSLRIKAWINPPSGGPQRAHDILCVDCDFHHGRRCSIGIIDCGLVPPAATWDQIIFRRCRIADTGDVGTPPWTFTPFTNYPGQAPGAGCDMEPNNQSQSINGVTFESCEFDGNGPRSWDDDHATSTGKSRAIGTDIGSVGNVGSHTRYLRIINCTFINRQNTSDEFAIILRQNDGPTDFSECEHVLVEGNTHLPGSSYYMAAFPAKDPNRGTLIDVQFRNNVIDTIKFRDLKPTGHTVVCHQNTKPGGGNTTIQFVNGPVATVTIS